MKIESIIQRDRNKLYLVCVYERTTTFMIPIYFIRDFFIVQAATEFYKIKKRYLSGFLLFREDDTVGSILDQEHGLLQYYNED